MGEPEEYTPEITDEQIVRAFFERGIEVIDAALEKMRRGNPILYGQKPD